MLAPAPTILDTYADLADVVEGRVPIERVPYRLWTTLSDADQAAAVAARRDVERDASLLASFRDRHGVDLADRSTILGQAERMARAEAEVAYYTGADDATGDSRGVVTAAGGAPVGSLDTSQQFGISDPGPRAKVDRVPPGQEDRARRIDRLQRYQRAKGPLAELAKGGANVVWETDPAGAILLDGMAERLLGCRRVKVYRDACGARFARPESCHVRVCPDCEASRSARLVRRLDGVAGKMRRGALWTLTAPNSPMGGLAAGIGVLQEAFVALRGRAMFAGGPCRGEHDDPRDRTAPRARCKHPPHRRDRARAGTCVCARCTRWDRDGVPGLDAGPCRHRLVGGRRCGLLAEEHVPGHKGRRPDVLAAKLRDAVEGDADHLNAGPGEADGGVGGVRLDRDDGSRGAGEGPFLDRTTPDAIAGAPGGRLVDEAHPATIDHLYRAGRRTVCRRCWHDPVRGGVYTIEVTYNAERREWHPHVHLLVDAPYITQAEMRDAWRAVTCDAIRRRELVELPAPAGPHPERDAAAARPPALPRCPHRADAEGRSIDGCRGASMVWVAGLRGEPGSPERRAAIRETVKYVTKGILGRDGDLNPGLAAADLAELLLSLHGRRLVNGWGTFRHVHDDPDDEDDGATGARLTGPDVHPDLRGLPATCPVCHQPADWQLPFTAARRDCVPLAGGILVWHPPPVTHGPT